VCSVGKINVKVILAKKEGK